MHKTHSPLPLCVSDAWQRYKYAHFKNNNDRAYIFRDKSVLSIIIAYFKILNHPLFTTNLINPTEIQYLHFLGLFTDIYIISSKMFGILVFRLILQSCDYQYADKICYPRLVYHHIIPFFCEAWGGGEMVWRNWWRFTKTICVDAEQNMLSLLIFNACASRGNYVIWQKIHKLPTFIYFLPCKWDHLIVIWKFNCFVK